MFSHLWLLSYNSSSQSVLVALVLALPAPLLLLLVVLTHVLAQLGLCVHCIFAQCRMIAPNSSLQDWHAFALDKEPWFVSLLGVYNRNEDSFNRESGPEFSSSFFFWQEA